MSSWEEDWWALDTSLSQRDRPSAFCLSLTFCEIVTRVGDLR